MKIKMISDQVKLGNERAPHRSLLFATAPLDCKKWEAVEPCRLRAYRDGTCVLTGTPHHNEYINNPEDMRLLFLDYALL